MQARQGAWSLVPCLGKFTIVVDEDIDIHDPAAVEWALGWTVQPSRDAHIVDGTFPMGLGPSNVPGALSSKIGIDATREGRYPARSLPPNEHLDAVRAAWAEYGIGRPADCGWSGA